MEALTTLTLKEMADAIRAGKLTSARLTRAFLDRIEAVNPALNAVPHLEAEMAMKYAERADLALQGGETPGRLFGIPMTIKDSLDTFDMITTWGTLGRQAFRPGNDASCVARLRNEGAILMGKTNTPEFTLAFKTDNLVYGRTNNPYDLSRTPGGSSGGAAAAIAAGATPFDVGTDTGGSIRLPAHFCGVAGIKPTTGRVPCTGNGLPTTGLITPLTQPGPMARNVEDLTLLLDIMRGPDNIDPHTVPAPWHNPEAVNINTLKLSFHTDNGLSQPDPPILDAIGQVIALLGDEGIRTTEARPTGIEMANFIYGRLLNADNGDMLDMLLEDSHTTQPSAEVKPLLGRRDIDGMSAREFAQLINLWHNYQASMLAFFNDFDVILCPVNAHTAIGHDQPEDFPAYSYTMAYNLTGWPSAVIRVGTDPNGLPIGIQIVAAPFREDHCLAVAGFLESRLGEFPGPSL